MTYPTPEPPDPDCRTCAAGYERYESAAAEGKYFHSDPTGDDPVPIDCPSPKDQTLKEGSPGRWA